MCLTCVSTRVCVLSPVAATAILLRVRITTSTPVVKSASMQVLPVGISFSSCCEAFHDRTAGRTKSCLGATEPETLNP